MRNHVEIAANPYTAHSDAKSAPSADAKWKQNNNGKEEKSGDRLITENP